MLSKSIFRKVFFLCLKDGFIHVVIKFLKTIFWIGCCADKPLQSFLSSNLFGSNINWVFVSDHHTRFHHLVKSLFKFHWVFFLLTLLSSSILLVIFITQIKVQFSTGIIQDNRQRRLRHPIISTTRTKCG